MRGIEALGFSGINKESAPLQADSSVLKKSVHLPVLEALLEQALIEGKQNSLKKTAIYYVHHPLQTSVNVIEALMELGAKPANIFILGKRYSECEAVVFDLIARGVHYQPCSMQNGTGQYSYGFIRDINWLWAKLMEQIDTDNNVEEVLVLDHGGHAITYLPQMILKKYKVIGIEKTTAGFINSDKKGLAPIPIIDVANSAAKRFLESPLIAEAVVNKIEFYLPKDKQNYIFGVVGLGAIGQAVMNRLQQFGCRMIVHDIDPAQLQSLSNNDKIVCTNNLAALIAASDYIFGCSGRDISEGQLEQFRLSSKTKTLISCSSEDKEYLSLLQMINQQVTYCEDPLANIEYKTVLGASIHILRGGFPVNFDSTGESVPANDIQLTRSLVLAAVLQAVEFFKNPNVKKGVYALNPVTQKFIVGEWLKYQDKERVEFENLTNYLNEDWLATHSNGLKISG